tara:strand:- start:106405 stop:106830 length:426 start_codon:yes stop_codon:yes gene_type:complete
MEYMKQNNNLISRVVDKALSSKVHIWFNVKNKTDEELIKGLVEKQAKKNGTIVFDIDEISVTKNKEFRLHGGVLLVCGGAERTYLHTLEKIEKVKKSIKVVIISSTNEIEKIQDKIKDKGKYIKLTNFDNFEKEFNLLKNL